MVGGTIWASTAWLLTEANSASRDTRAQLCIEAIRTALAIGQVPGGHGNLGMAHGISGVRWLPRLQAVAALDQFLRAGVDVGVLVARAAVLGGERNARQLREVLALGDRGAMLPGESWTRTVIVDTGFPRPRTQVSVPRPLGTDLFIDLGYREFRVGVEYDGERHHVARRDREHDESRRDWLRKELGWELIVVTKSDVLMTPYPFLAALMTALFERGWSPDDDELTDICTRLDRLKSRRRS